MDEPERMQEEILAGNAAQLAPMAVHASTQTSCSLTDALAQTDLQLPPPDLAMGQNEPPSPGQASQAPPEASFRDSSHKPCRERQRHYATIRAKLEHMVSSLSQRHELAGAPKTAESQKGFSRQRTHKDDIQEANARLP